MCLCIIMVSLVKQLVSSFFAGRYPVSRIILSLVKLPSSGDSGWEASSMMMLLCNNSILRVDDF